MPKLGDIFSFRACKRSESQCSRGDRLTFPGILLRSAIASGTGEANRFFLDF
ncbi:MAG TPA: hypothetical protein V6C85_21495 [Allocoleopsis sp.]